MRGGWDEIESVEREGVWRGDAGEFEPESEDESEPETDSERRRRSMGIGSEWGALLFSMGMAGAVKANNIFCD